LCSATSGGALFQVLLSFSSRPMLRTPYADAHDGPAALSSPDAQTEAVGGGSTMTLAPMWRLIWFSEVQTYKKTFQLFV